jgi:hypothetical protein
VSFRSGLIKTFGGTGLDAVAPAALVDQHTPAAWTATPFGPGAPMRPLGGLVDNGEPRTIDYPPTVNSTITPRSAYGLMPFVALKQAYETVDEVKTMVRILQSECSVFEPGLQDAEGNDISHDSALAKYIERPDGVLPWDVWANRIIASAAVYDAPCALFDLRNEIVSYVDGATIFCMVDENGHTPQPPQPAYSQVIHGIPWAWYPSDRLWYKPQNRRLDSPYGQPFIEVGWTAICMLALIAAFELSYYREGNVPEGFMFANDDQTFEQAQEYQRTLNSRMTAGMSERRRLQVVAGMKSYAPSKRADFPLTLYKQYHDNLAAAAGIPPSEFGETSGGRGLAGGKGSMDMMANSLFRTGLSPRIRMLKALMQDFFTALGVGNEVQFTLDMPTAGMDPVAQQANTLNQFINGAMKLNEAREAFGMESVEGGDVFFVVRSNQVINLSQALGLDVDPEADDQQAALAAIAQQPEASPADRALAQRMIAEGSASPGSSSSGSTGTSTETPSSAASSSGNTTKAALDITLHVDQPAMAPPAGDMPTDPDVAEKAAPRLVQKLTGVSDDDDAYWHAPLEGQEKIPWPKGGHANEVDIVAIVPTDPAYPPQPGVWKPVSGEKPGVQARLGPGQAQAVREECAYLLDRRLGFYLVPVAWLAEHNGEVGSVALFSEHTQPAKDVDEYSPFWVERAAVLEYVDGSIDRHGGNWLTHPSDGRRPVIIDNGLTFPLENKPVYSPFCDAYANKGLSADVLDRLARIRTDETFWGTIARMTDPECVRLALDRLDTLLADKKLTVVSRTEAEETGEQTLSDEPTPESDVLPDPETES